MKILHICAGWEKWNGAANIARLIMGEQERQGHEISFSSWTGIRYLRSADEVWIHCSWMPCLWWAALWGKNVHWMPEASYDPVRRAFHGWKKTIVGPIERFCLRRAKVIVATCEAERGWIEAYLGKRCPHIEVTDIKRFFDFSRVEGEKVRKNSRVEHVERVDGEAQKDSLHILYLGRCHPLKGVEYLEAAVRQMENSPPLHLSTARQNSALLRLCVKYVSSAFGEEKERVWNWCDVLVLPTLSENFGLVVAEALERGKRVITTDGAPAWGDGNDYGGRLVYLKGYRDGTSEERVMLLKNAIEKALHG